MRHARTWIWTIPLALSGCSTPQNVAPLLAPRAAESIDPRVPVVGIVDPRPVDPALAARLSELIAQANSGDSAFRSAAEEARRLAAVAGARESESWIAAQQAVSAAIAARAPTAQALSDIDALGATTLQAKGDLSPSNLAAIEAAAAEVGALDRAQAQIIRDLQVRLGG